MSDVPVTVVAGGTTGIGRATAELLLARGHRVVVLGLSDAGADAMTAELAGEELVVVAGDVTDPQVCDGVVTTAMERWGRVEGLVNCAAIRHVGTVLETDLSVWSRLFDVNVTGVFNMCRAVLPVMIRQRGGSIVNVGSASGYGGESHAAYAASKGAVLALSTSMALDHRRDRVRVNVVSPGSTRTPMNAGRDPRIDAVLAERDSVTGRINTVDDVARVIAFLLAADSGAVTGTVVDVGHFRGEPVRSVDVPPE